MKCPLCQKSNPDDSVFCEQCGKKIPRCPTCGTVIRKRMATCENDGTVLTEEVLALFPEEAPKPATDPAQQPAAAAMNKMMITVMVVMLLAIVAIGILVTLIWAVPKALKYEKTDVALVQTYPAEYTAPTVTEETQEPEEEEVTYIYRYEVVRGDVTWTEAQAACEAKGGYLATITSQEEYEKIAVLAEQSGVHHLWIGAYLPSSSTSWKEAGWITGEEWTFEKWYPGEPSVRDRDGTYENYLCLWSVNDGPWTFNDERNNMLEADGSISGNIGYIIEYKEEAR